MTSARQIIIAVFLAVCFATGTAPGAQNNPELVIVEPTAGQTVRGPDLAVRVRVANIELGGQARNGAHLLLRLDDLPPMKSHAERFTFRGVADGPHHLAAELRRPDGSAFDPPVRAEVRFVIDGRERGR